MLARVSSGKTGIVEYLVDGVKSGRELSRDELDLRDCIDGNLQLTGDIINQYNATRTSDAYLHITLSFGERDIERDLIIKAYELYKEKLMNAYNVDEYNVYAEIHHPKVKSYIDKKTGEHIERFPHVHMVIPKTHLLSGNVLAPFGRYKDNIQYHDAIQESVNRKLGLESPYDNQRKYRLFSDNSEFISRYKGDVFKGQNYDLRSELFDLINNKDIRTMAAFEKELARFGEVGKGKLGSAEQYLKIKPHGKSKFVRLKDNCFKQGYIERRELERPKPSNATIEKNLDEWVRTRSHEMKHIHPASPSFRKQYYSSTPQQKEELLNARRTEFERTYHLREGGRTTNRLPRAQSNGLKRFTQIANGLPSVPQRSLARATGRRTESSQGVLHDHADNHLESKRARGDHQLRRSTDDRRRRIKEGIVGAQTTGLPMRLSVERPVTPTQKPMSVAQAMLASHRQQKTSEKEQALFRGIRAKLEPERLLDSLAVSHGIVRSNYDVFHVKGGAGRIRIGKRAYNVSDFCTQHMHLPWEDTKTLLKTLYKRQELEKQEHHIVNAISFDSSLVQQSWSKTTWLDETIRLFNQLVREEQKGEFMGLQDLKNWRHSLTGNDNAIRDSEVELRKIHDNFKRQQALADELTLAMSDLVATKDSVKKRVTFKDVNTGKELFRDVGEHILMAERKPDAAHVAAAMTLAAKKFGTVRITGTDEFKQQVIDVAVTKDLKIVFSDNDMQEKFLVARKAFRENIAEQKHTNENSITEGKATVERDDIESKQDSNQDQDKEVVTLVAHGSAPYEHNEKNSESYFVELSDGKTLWGVGLKSAIEESGAQVGDVVDVKRTGEKDVTVMVDKLDEQGKVLGKEAIETHRVEWEVLVKQPEQAVEPLSLNSVDELALEAKRLFEESDHLTDDNKPKEAAVAFDKARWLVNEVAQLTEKNPFEGDKFQWLSEQFDKDRLEIANKKWDASEEIKLSFKREDQMITPLFNGKEASEVPHMLLNRICGQSDFLKQYSLEEITGGALNSKASAVPVEQSFSRSGKLAEEVVETQTFVLKS